MNDRFLGLSAYVDGGPGSHPAGVARAVRPRRGRDTGASTLIVAAALLFSACAKRASHTLKGVIVDIQLEPPALVVDHEEIPGFMGAMTMRFAVDAATVTRGQKGQTITARLRYSDGKWRLDHVQVIANP